MRIPILRLMERMADHWCNMGTLHMFWKWWWNYTSRILMPTSPINKPTMMPNKEILTITFTFPEEDLVDPHILAQTTPYIHPTPPLPPTSLQRITWKASMTFRGALLSEEIFIAPLSWQPPTWLPCIPFELIFPLSKISPQSSPIIHLGQQIQCITSYIDLVDKMLYDSMEQKRYWYLPDSGLWYDSILKLKWDFTFNFDYPEDMYKNKDKQPQDPTNFKHKWSIATKEHPPLSHMLKLFLNILKTPKTPLPFLPTIKNMPAFIGPFVKKITNMGFLGTTMTIAPSTTKFGKWQPDSFHL